MYNVAAIYNIKESYLIKLINIIYRNTPENFIENYRASTSYSRTEWLNPEICRATHVRNCCKRIQARAIDAIFSSHVICAQFQLKKKKKNCTTIAFLLGRYDLILHN